jgi:short-subunit dehydrogenase
MQRTQNLDGRWAVVTGASSGLGPIFAERLAQRGFALVLTGRDAKRLAHVATTIRDQKPRVDIDVVVADLAAPRGVAILVEALEGRRVDVLVNNAGFGSYGPFASADGERESNLVAVDVTAPVRLTHAVLPGMLERGSGQILNVASTIAFQPAPYQAVYGAAKAFLLSFSQALGAETSGSGITVAAVCPGPTRTGFVTALRDDVSHTAIYRKLGEPGPVVEAGLRALDRGRSVVVVGARNRVLATSGRFLPRRLLTRLTARLLRPVDIATDTTAGMHTAAARTSDRKPR